MTRTVFAALLAGLVLIAARPATADSNSQPNLCPHTANAKVFEDNAVAYNATTKSWLKTSLEAAAQLQMGDMTIGFVYLDDAGNTWVLLLPSADQRTQTYFKGTILDQTTPLSAFGQPFHPLPNWLHVRRCPSP
jgi:hypothetical protein